MIDMISVQLARFVIVGVIGFTVVIHVLVLAGVLPLKIVWGGRIENRRDLVRAEIGSMVVLGVAVLVALFQAQAAATGNPAPLWTIGSWVMAALFALNTLGNLASRSVFERALFTPLTIVLAILFVRLALG